MDHNIRIKAEGLGKQGSGLKQKLLQTKKNTSSNTGATAQIGRDTIANLKSLNSSINKLISSNNELAKAVSGMRAGRGGGGVGSGVGAAAGRAGARFGGFGGIGATIPGIAAIGFAIQKINQIGSAYIEKTSQQLQSVGVAGFRRSRGMYLAGQACKA